ncbi:MAG: peroxiredoxin [Flavobacteriaceae bacterium]
MIDIGDAAPAFSLPASGGKTITLSDLIANGPAVLFFYPKDDTSGCTAESIDFSGLREAFIWAGATVTGISPDSARTHDRFRKKHGLTVDLVSDEAKTTLEAYGVWVEKSMYGRKYMGVQRSTFIIGTDGRIARVWRKVSVPGHAAEVLDAVEALTRS